MEYEDFFTNYLMVEPPEILLDQTYIEDNVEDNIEDNSFSSTNNMIENYPGIVNPFETDDLFDEPVISNEPTTSNKPVTLKGPESFEVAFLKAVEINPEVAEYKNFLVKTAKRESNFNSHVLNTSGAPYYGYFQMGKEEIKRTTGLTVEEFRNNPVQLILGAVKLYKMNLKTIKALKVYELGKLKGYSDDALVAGAWMGGPGGVKKYLLGKGDPSDSHWYGGKGGSSVGKIMNNWKDNE